MDHIPWKLRGTAAAVCAGLVTAVVACSGDDTTTPVASPDASSSSSTSSTSTTSSSSTSSLSDASADSSLDAAPPPLNLCSVFDSDFDFSYYQADGAAPPPPLPLDASLYNLTRDRTDTWVASIVTSFVQYVSNDCRVDGIMNALAADDAGAEVAVANWDSQLDLWTEEFVGCPDQDSDGGPPSEAAFFPTDVAGHVFTTADLAVFDSLYREAITETVAGSSFYEDLWVYGEGLIPPETPGIGTPPPPAGTPFLTDDQVSAIDAQLSYLASTLPESQYVPSSKLTFSTCEADAGTAEAGGADAGGD